MSATADLLWYFGTISLEDDFTSCEKLWTVLKKWSSTVVVQDEVGVNGKKHTHWVNLMSKPYENFRRAIVNCLKKDYGIENVGKYGLKICAETQPYRRIGYILKDCMIPKYSTGITVDFLENCNNTHMRKPYPKKNQEFTDGKFSLNKFAKDLKDEVSNLEEFEDVINLYLAKDVMSFTQFQKLSIKKLRQYVLQKVDIE